MSLEKGLLKTTGVKPQGGSEPRQKFLFRVMMGVRKLSDDAWGELEALDGAQEWYNEAVEADNEKQALPDFPDAEPAADEEEPEDAEDVEEDAVEDDAVEDEDEDEDEEPAPKKKAPAAKKAPAKAATKPAKKAAAKANGAAKAPPAKTKGKPAAKLAAEKAAGKPSMRRMLKRIVIKKPKMTTEDLITELERKGYDSPSKLTVTSIRADTRDTIKVLNEAGLTSIDI